MQNIFRDHAPRYWDAGIPVIPLKRWNSPGSGAGKAPIISDWTQYGETMPSEGIRQLWLSSFANSNMGLPFGEASGLCALDIDTEDEALIAAIRDAIPPTPWVRIGHKGMGLIYRWRGQPNFKLRDSDNNSIVEFLGKGNQMVVPPSIHPKTEKPYLSDNDLVDVLDKIVALPADIEDILRGALEPIIGKMGLSLGQAGRSSPLEVVPEGNRDIMLVRYAGYLARVVLGIDRSNNYSLAEGMEQMQTWVLEKTASVSGDDIDPQKGVAKLLEFLLKDMESGKTLPNGWDEGLTDKQREHEVIARMIEMNEVKRWTLTKARDWLDARVVGKPGDFDYAWESIEKLIGEVAQDDNFSESTLMLLIPSFKAAMGGNTVSRADVRKMWRDAKQTDHEQAEDHEAIARAIYEDICRGGELRYYNQQFYQWNGSCFKVMPEEEVIATVSQVKGNVLSRRQNDYVAITKMIAVIARKEIESGTDHGINFANGYLDSGMVLHPHDPKFGCTFTLPFNYIPERAVEAHKWLAFLEDCWGDDPDYEDKVNALQEAFAATLFGKGPTYQRVVLLYGRGGTGKSQLLEVIQAMMPPDAKSFVSPEKWGQRFQDAPLVSSILNVCGELPEAAALSGKDFKEVVAGDSRETELKGKPLFHFHPKAMHWFSSNFLPRTRDTSDGFTRRWLFLEFLNVVKKEDRIPDLYKMLVAEEREAIAAWAVQGMERLTRNGDYTLPESSQKITEMSRRANNSMIAFLENSDKVRKSEDDAADLRNVFDCYVLYMKEISRGWSVTFERFREMVKGAGYELRDYEDGVGLVREEIVGLKLLQAILPHK